MLAGTVGETMVGHDSAVLHEEWAALRGLSIGLAAAGVTAALVDISMDYASGGWLVLSMPFLLILSWITWGVYGYNHLVLTPSSLRVGHETFVRDDFDRWFGVQPEVLLDPEEQHRVENATPLPPNADIRIAGGSWERRLGTSMVLLREAETQQLVAVFSRDARRLAEVLTAWLGDTIPDQ